MRKINIFKSTFFGGLFLAFVSYITSMLIVGGLDANSTTYLDDALSVQFKFGLIIIISMLIVMGSCLFALVELYREAPWVADLVMKGQRDGINRRLKALKYLLIAVVLLISLMLTMSLYFVYNYIKFY